MATTCPHCRAQIAPGEGYYYCGSTANTRSAICLRRETDIVTFVNSLLPDAYQLKNLYGPDHKTDRA